MLGVSGKLGDVTAVETLGGAGGGVGERVEEEGSGTGCEEKAYASLG